MNILWHKQLPPKSRKCSQTRIDGQSILYSNESMIGVGGKRKDSTDEVEDTLASFVNNLAPKCNPTARITGSTSQEPIPTAVLGMKLL